jgi:hypothetical protein
MIVEIGTVAGQFLFWECINGIFVVVHPTSFDFPGFYPSIANAELKKK